MCRVACQRGIQAAVALRLPVRWPWGGRRPELPHCGHRVLARELKVGVGVMPLPDAKMGGAVCLGMLMATQSRTWTVPWRSRRDTALQTP